MFTLNPGPSQVSPETKDDIRRAIDDGILELSHRSSRFTEISKKCIDGLRRYLEIPEEYRVYYFDSATQVWHSIAANLVEQSSFHFVNGSFSEKAYEAARLLGKAAVASKAEWGTQNDFTVQVPEDTEVVTVCYNETSTGVAMTADELVSLRRLHPNRILAVDITSCAGGIPLSLSEADAWYFSVQKCFGLPAGLGIGIFSPRTLERSQDLARRGKNLTGIWAWEYLEKHMEKHQTPHTPNVLGIYLLGEQCARRNSAGGIAAIAAATNQKNRRINEWMRSQSRASYFVKDGIHRSQTVCAVQASEADIQKAKAACAAVGITLGSGYGKIKAETFRIANFPAVSEEMLKEALSVIGESLR